ncbi:MAG: polysaccharide deacetylase family protein [Blastochloris sp.]|nr:polysaccharide deacetylase family protein [Blastochloris sp.]
MQRKEFLKVLTAGLIGSQFSSFPGLAQDDSAHEPLKGEYQFNPHFVWRGPGLGRRIAMTFDDGPSPGITEIVLAELAKRNLTATFFMIGSKVERYPALAKAVADAGHEIGNHSFTHPTLSSLSEDRVDQELERTQHAIAQATGQTPVWFRPPYGAFRNNQGHIPQSKNLGVAYWSVDPRDWAKPGVSAIVSRINSGTNPGSIILLHDLHRQTADATGAVLDQLMEASYTFTSLTGFLGQPYSPANAHAARLARQS